METIIMNGLSIINESNRMDGNLVSREIRSQIKNIIEGSTPIIGRPPMLAIVHVAYDPASEVYLRHKLKDCQEVGIRTIETRIPFSELMDTEDLKRSIYVSLKSSDLSDTVDGIIVQLPIPKLSKSDIYELMDGISPVKDVDGLGYLNVSRLSRGSGSHHAPCTPKGIMRLLEHYNIDLKGKNVTIVGRSDLVGKPLSCLMESAGATVTLCHSHTKDLSHHINMNTDIVVFAVGKPKFYYPEMIHDRTIIIDVGINRMEDGSLSGDVYQYHKYQTTKEFKYVTPVPGGVGPMTRAMLLQNVVDAWKANHESRVVGHSWRW